MAENAKNSEIVIFPKKGEIREIPISRRRGSAPQFSDELFEEICQRIAVSEKGLRTVLGADDRFPSAESFMRWIERSNDLAQRYARAKSQQCDMLAEDILDITDDPTLEPNDKKVRVDARKWILSKLVPKKYGDRIDITSAGEQLAAPAQHIDARVQSIVMQAAQRMALGVKPEELEGLDQEAKDLLG